MRGLTVWGLTTMSPNEVSDDPVFLSEEMVDKLIVAGSLTNGSLNKLRVIPDRSKWPARWAALKTDL